MRERDTLPVIVITPGDPAGVGPEIIAKTLAQLAAQGGAGARLIVLGRAADFSGALGAGGAPAGAGAGLTSAAADWVPFSEAIWACDAPVLWVELPGGAGAIEAGPIEPGIPSEAGARVAIEALELAVAAAREGKADGIVTAPIHKENLRRAGFTHPGHTEFLAERAGVPRVAMLLVGGGLRVALATIHEPLARVPGLLRADELVGALKLIHASARDYGFERPRIGVAGLNPHAGEGGLFGREEIEIIAPATRAARELGIDASGPFSADTLFHRALGGEFDFVLAMYHDQGLIPVKTLDFHGGVNATLGLPFVRTSPDHGVAFEIAGRGIANPGSMTAALKLAIELAARRRDLRLG